MLKKLLFLTWSITLLSQVYASVGNISLLRGTADIDRQSSIIEAKVLMDIEEQDKVSTKEDTKMQITFKDDTVITLGALTSFGVEEFLEDDKNSKASFSVTQGAFKVITGKIGKLAPKNFMFKTKSSSIGIRGTIFVGEVNLNNEGRDYITCLDGSIVVTSLISGQEVILTAGQMVIIHADGTMEKPTSLYPQNPQNFSLLSFVQSPSIPTTTPKEADRNEYTEIENLTSIVSRGASWHDDLKYDDKYNRADNSPSTQPTQPTQPTPSTTTLTDMQTLIKNKAVHNYSGKGNGTFDGVSNDGQDLVRLKGKYADADINMKIDFGGNVPMELKLSNQKIQLTSATSNGIQATPTELDELTNDMNSMYNQLSGAIDSGAPLKINTSIDPAKSSLVGSFKDTGSASGISVTQDISINGNFKNANAGKFIGTLKQTTTASGSSGESANMQANINFDLSKQ